MQAEQLAGSRIPLPRSVPAFILCGGRGTRLRAVESRPKAIIPVAGLPFLEYTLRLLRLQGFRRIHLLLGEGADEVASVISGSGIEHVREETPLGTGGALGNARDRAAWANLILNGDSHAEFIYSDLLATHLLHGPDAAHGVTLLALKVDRSRDYGGLDIDLEGRVRSFSEKGVAGPGWINAGVYVAGGDFFQGLPQGSYSLERDILPDLAARGLLRALPRRFFFRDIGTPDRLARAQEEFRWVRNRMGGAA